MSINQIKTFCNNCWKWCNIPNTFVKGSLKCTAIKHKTLQLTRSKDGRFCGNQVADELATYEFYNHPDVLTMRQQLIAEVSRYETLRDQAHQVFIKVGKLAMTKSRTETQQAAEDPRRDLQLAPVRIRPWSFPDQLPPEAEHYFLDDWPCVAEWMNSFHTGVGTVQFLVMGTIVCKFSDDVYRQRTLVQPQAVN